MSDVPIPDDIDAKAVALVDAYYMTDIPLREFVGRALMAERERCAVVAERFDPGAYCESTPQALDDCAAAIRRGTPNV